MSFPTIDLKYIMPQHYIILHFHVQMIINSHDYRNASFERSELISRHTTSTPEAVTAQTATKHSVALPNLSINGNQPIKQLIPRSHSGQLISLIRVLAYKEQSINHLLATHSPANNQLSFPAHPTELPHLPDISDRQSEQNGLWLLTLQMQSAGLRYLGRKVQHRGLFGRVNHHRPALTFVSGVETDWSDRSPDPVFPVQYAERTKEDTDRFDEGL